MKFVKKTPTIDAIQFKGGYQSAIDVIRWLFEQERIPAAYVPEISVDGKVAVFEHIEVRGGYRNGSGFNVGVGDWAVSDEDGIVYRPMSDDNFREQYEPAED